MLLRRFIQHVVDEKLFSATDRLLIAVSGGVDSVVLCDLCYNAGYSFEIAHVNFQLRGEESLLDECFVKGLAEHYRVSFHTTKFNTNQYASEHKVSVQVAARELRYQWFKELLGDRFKCILTAHHADDNIETVLMNFFRGTGISGLRGMQSTHNNIVRPLLPFTKQEILAYAKEKKLNWREDSSNSSDKYSRNYFRNAILPLVYKVYPEAEHNILHNIQRFGETEQLFNQAIEHHKKKLLEYKGNEVHIPILKLKKCEPLHTIVFEIVRQYNFTPHQVNEILHLLDGEQGSHVQSGTHRVFRNRNWLIISPNQSTEANNILIKESEDSVHFNGSMLTFQLAVADSSNLSAAKTIAELDSRKVKYPLILRRWKAGDYFYPLGMKKKKKVSRFLIDNKLSPTEKEKVWVLETEKRICWVVGMRIDERFKILASTKETLKLTVTG